MKIILNFRLLRFYLCQWIKQLIIAHHSVFVKYEDKLKKQIRNYIEHTLAMWT